MVYTSEIWALYASAALFSQAIGQIGPGSTFVLCGVSCMRNRKVDAVLGAHVVVQAPKILDTVAVAGFQKAIVVFGDPIGSWQIRLGKKLLNVRRYRVEISRGNRHVGRVKGPALGGIGRQRRAAMRLVKRQAYQGTFPKSVGSKHPAFMASVGIETVEIELLGFSNC